MGVTPEGLTLAKTSFESARLHLPKEYEADVCNRALKGSPNESDRPPSGWLEKR